MERQTRAAAIERWKEKVDSFNPLDPEFTRKRIKILDLMHPVSQKIERKRLIDCELIGPANIVFTGTSKNKAALSGVSFYNCEVVVAKENSFIQNVAIMEDVEMIGGSI